MKYDGSVTKSELELQIQFMTKKLKEERELLENEGLVVDYDNGGGQTGVRKNPRYEAYSILMATYLRTIKYYAERYADEDDNNETVFDEMIRQLRIVE